MRPTPTMALTSAICLLIAIHCIAALFVVNAFGASPTWMIQTAGSPSGGWTTVASGTSSQMFARLVLSNAPASTVAIGGVINVTNSMFTISNGVETAVIHVGTNQNFNLKVVVP